MSRWRDGRIRISVLGPLALAMAALLALFLYSLQQEQARDIATSLEHDLDHTEKLLYEESMEDVETMRLLGERLMLDQALAEAMRRQDRQFLLAAARPCLSVLPGNIKLHTSIFLPPRGKPCSGRTGRRSTAIPSNGSRCGGRKRRAGPPMGWSSANWANWPCGWLFPGMMTVS